MLKKKILIFVFVFLFLFSLDVFASDAFYKVIEAINDIGFKTKHQDHETGTIVTDFIDTEKILVKWGDKLLYGGNLFQAIVVVNDNNIFYTGNLLGLDVNIDGEVKGVAFDFGAEKKLIEILEERITENLN